MGGRFRGMTETTRRSVFVAVIEALRLQAADFNLIDRAQRNGVRDSDAVVLAERRVQRSAVGIVPVLAATPSLKDSDKTNVENTNNSTISTYTTTTSKDLGYRHKQQNEQYNPYDRKHAPYTPTHPGMDHIKTPTRSPLHVNTRNYRQPRQSTYQHHQPQQYFQTRRPYKRSRTPSPRRNTKRVHSTIHVPTSKREPTSTNQYHDDDVDEDDAGRAISRLVSAMPELS
jgi:hypothetical protein